MVKARPGESGRHDRRVMHNSRRSSTKRIVDGKGMRGQ